MTTAERVDLLEARLALYSEALAILLDANAAAAMSKEKHDRLQGLKARILAGE